MVLVTCMRAVAEAGVKCTLCMMLTLPETTAVCTSPASTLHQHTHLPCCVCCFLLQSRVRLGRVWREGNVHHFVEWMVHTVCGCVGRGGCMRVLGVGGGQQSLPRWALAGSTARLNIITVAAAAAAAVRCRCLSQTWSRPSWRVTTQAW